MTKGLLAVAVLVLCGLMTASCKKDLDYNGASGGDDLEGCTPLYKGYATYSDTKMEDLTLYYSEEAGDYFVPYIFTSTAGEVAFLWDKTTNVLKLESTATGLSNYLSPVYIIDQNDYDITMGTDALVSTYDPVTKVFDLHVVLRTTDEVGALVNSPLDITFTVTGDAE